MKKKIIATALFVMIPAMLLGCNGTNAIAPDNSGLPVPLEPAAGCENDALLFGAWNIRFDTENLTAEITPLRESLAHFDITGMLLPPACIDCLKIVVNSFNAESRMIDVDVSIRHHYSFTGYDVRGILYTDDFGHIMLFPDDWTNSFDIPGGEPFNPFKAFAKSTPNRAFAPGEQHTEKYLIYIPTPAHYETITFAVTASWPGNCGEPYEIANFVQENIFEPAGSSGIIRIDVRDWQNDVSKVTLSAPAITGEQYTQFTKTGEETWSLNLVNKAGFKHGTYNCRVIATSSGAPTKPLYDYLPVKITDKAYGLGISWGGTGDDSGNAVTVDGEGNIYIAGNFSMAVDFDPGPSVDIHHAMGYQDIFLSKFDHDGKFLWAKTWGSDAYPDYEDDNALGITFDPAGNIYVIGRFIGVVDFLPGDMYEYHASNGYTDIFISKFTTGGDFLWARTWGGGYDDCGIDAVVDGNGNVIVAGYFDYYQGTPVDFNPGEGFDQHVSNGSYDIFVSKFKSNGDFLWARTWGSSEGDSVGGLGVDKWNNIFVHGNCGWADLDPGPGIDFKPGGGFLSKFNQGGAYQWSRNWGDSNVYTAGMAVDASGNVFLTGSFYGEMDFDPGPGTEIHSSGDYEDVYLIKFDPLGYYFWGLSWGGEYNDEGWCIDVNDAGEVFVAGSFTDLVDFDPGPGVEEHWGGYDPQGFISKFDTNSQFQWVITCGPMYPLDIEIGPFGGIHTTGNFSETVDLDPGPGQNLHKSFGYSDACVVRYTKDGDW